MDQLDQEPNQLVLLFSKKEQELQQKITQLLNDIQTVMEPSDDKEET